MVRTSERKEELDGRCRPGISPLWSSRLSRRAPSPGPCPLSLPTPCRPGFRPRWSVLFLFSSHPAVSSPTYPIGVGLESQLLWSLRAACCQHFPARLSHPAWPRVPSLPAHHSLCSEFRARSRRPLGDKRSITLQIIPSVSASHLPLVTHFEKVVQKERKGDKNVLPGVTRAGGSPGSRESESRCYVGDAHQHENLLQIGSMAAVTLK